MYWINKSVFLFLNIVIFAVITSCSTTIPHHQGCYVVDVDIRGIYTGECKDGKADGFGKAMGKDTYQGGFVKGKKEGTGTYIWKNGNRYLGQFKNDERHGRGVKIDKENHRIDEEWENGRQIR